MRHNWSHPFIDLFQKILFWYFKKNLSRKTIGLIRNFKLPKINYQSDDELETKKVYTEELLTEFSVKTRDQGSKYRFSENESHIPIEDFWNKSLSRKILKAS